MHDLTRRLIEDDVGMSNNMAIESVHVQFGDLVPAT